MTAMKWFYSFLRKHNRRILFGLFLVTAISVLAIAKPIVSGSIVDDVITAGNYDLLPKLIVLLILITVVRGLLRYISQIIFETCSQDVLYSMRDTVYRKLLQEDFNFYNKKRTGDLLSRQTGDMDDVRKVSQYEDDVDMLEEELRDKHIERLSRGECQPSSGVVFLDIISNLERISDHAYNLAGYVKDEM